MMDELVFNGQCGKGSSDKARVKIIQEWLGLNGFGVAIDGQFGPATEQAVKAFQKRFKLPVTGIVDHETYQKLVLPMTTALAVPYPPKNPTLGIMMVTYAMQHLAAHPREIGGQNCGPWVRLYMDGREGTVWPWCAGFVSFILKQACERLNRPLPFTTSFSCNIMAKNAIDKKLFHPGSDFKTFRGENLTGAIFLVKHNDKWSHTGIVIEAKYNYFSAIEGNTNDSGSPEGYEVCKRTRNYDNKDFILLA